ncbi:MAG TPA: cobalamin-dependent protein [Solirubrobacterales bacterium]|nr:cobalamin-dependent protein [Solirubrobacterales bacterium]
MLTPTRVLIAKPGLDGHDRGGQVVARILRDAGFEVIYSGLRQSPEVIARTAVSEDVAIVGVSLLSGSHLEHCAAIRERLDELGARDVAIVLGGVIPDDDIPALREIGVSAVVGVGATPDQVVAAVEDVVTARTGGSEGGRDA